MYNLTGKNNHRAGFHIRNEQARHMSGMMLAAISNAWIGEIKFSLAGIDRTVGKHQFQFQARVIGPQLDVSLPE